MKRRTISNPALATPNKTGKSKSSNPGYPTGLIGFSGLIAKAGLCDITHGYIQMCPKEQPSRCGAIPSPPGRSPFRERFSKQWMHRERQARLKRG